MGHTVAAPDFGGHEGLIARALSFWKSRPLAWRLVATALLGAAGATGTGYVTSKNPNASPADVAVVFRVLLIGTLIAAGIYAQTSKSQARMGGLLIAAGLFSSLWLVNGSSNRVLFSIGVLCAGLAQTLFPYLMLAHPRGHLHSRTEHRLLWCIGGLLMGLWVLAVLTARQPPLKTPLLQCAPHCPDNAFSLGSATDAVAILTVPIVVAWVAIAWSTPVLLFRHVRSASAPVRRSLIPVSVVAAASAALSATYLVSLAVGSGVTSTIGAVYVGTAVAIPLAILLGLSRERLFMGRALADFVSKLARSPRADPQVLMSTALHDPSLRIAYQRPALGTYVDFSGTAVDEPPTDSAITWIQRDRRRVAAVIYSPELADQEWFVQAAGAAALMQLEHAQLEADLKASATELAASRVRLMEAANAERRRLERDLHDGVQQQLVGLRLKLELAADTVKHDAVQGQRELAAVGEQMDDVLRSLRSLAGGIYPSLLHERGLGEALKSAARRSPLPVAVRATGLGRYREDVEVAVYFCCLEALQNVVKHAEGGAGASMTVKDDGTRLSFEIRDSGIGFDPGGAAPGSGLTNMRDRIHAVGGTLTVTSRRRHGTSVRGSVPVVHQ